MRLILIATLVTVSFSLTAQEKSAVMVEQADTTCLLPNEEVLPYTIVDEKPLFNEKSELSEFLNWMFANLRYPEEYGDISLQGTIVVSFVVNRNGYVCNAEIIRSMDKLIDAEVLRAINQSPQWQPAVFRGKNVSVNVVIPLRIKL